ncbi:MAG: glycosyltransferase family A protein [Solirubrobacterales bacterium]
MPAITIITPSFNNGPTLKWAIESVRRQSFTDYEHFIVGDGIVDTGREIAERYVAEDSRARFFDNPKGPRHGEDHRHAALRQASGEVICYISDDDLWFDDHLERMLRLIPGFDFVHTLSVCAFANGTINLYYTDMSTATYRERMLSGINDMSPCALAHTREAYNRLERGWSADIEPGMPGDLACWQQFLRIDGLRYGCGGTVSSLHVPAGDPDRVPGDEARYRQLEELMRILRDPGRAAGLRQRLTDDLYRHAAARQADSIYFRELAEQLEDQLREARQEIQRRPTGLRDALRRRLLRR